MKGYSEEAFETFIFKQLLENGGYEAAEQNDFKIDLGLMPEILFAFLEKTQTKVWQRLRGILKEELESKFIHALCQKLEKRGTVDTLRHPLDFYGEALSLFYARPGNERNPDTLEAYRQNCLHVARQLAFDPKNKRRELDLALFLNGLPIATAELKNPLTEQGYRKGIEQYQKNRDPNAPIFAWSASGEVPTRALVHFVIDPYEAWMTTRVQGQRTRFLPFNKGNNKGKGNPIPSGEHEGKHHTHYVWEQVWQRDSLLDLVHRFIYVETKEETDPDTRRVSVKKTLIFPRYHQLRCVRRLVAAAREKGAGHNYLVQHSAGSGKSNSIAWLAFHLAKLHDDADIPVYNSVIVLTDRKVLDQQLQLTLSQFDPDPAQLESIDKDSAQLAKAIQTGTVKIIVSTIQKFGFIQDKVAELPDRRYALIVDEAHSSQTGEMAVQVKELLSSSAQREKLAEKIAERGEHLSTPDQLALRAALYRGPQENMSFFAFTATPKNKTLKLFGHTDENGKPKAFDLYSMRQAIEEEFILNVLLGYITYQRFFELAKAIPDDPDVDKRQAGSALARFVNLHPTNIARKTEIIVEHFRGSVQHQLAGRAKAMVVAGSRVQAVRYKKAFDKYFAEQGYSDMRCLVAFSGEVEDETAQNGSGYTEVEMNGGIKETELAMHFASKRYQMLIVANKYQTGFNEPRLAAMYVDKRLGDIQAVQTLSRLNRTMRGKKGTVVIDFVNKREEILNSFQDFYESTTTEGDVDPQRLYQLRDALRDDQVYTLQEIDRFVEAFFASKARRAEKIHQRLSKHLDPAIDRFEHLGEEGTDRERRQEGFRGRLTAFKNLYAFLSQVIPFQDARLEKLYIFSRFLLRRLATSHRDDPLDLDEDVILASLRLQKVEEGDLELQKGVVGERSGPNSTGTGKPKAAFEKLSAIIERINERFGKAFGPAVGQLIEGTVDELTQDETQQQAALANDKANFRHVLVPALDDLLVERHSQNSEFINSFFENEALGEFVRAVVLDAVYDRLKGAKSA